MSPQPTTSDARGGRRRSGLDREAVLRAALHLVDRDGVDALTMRAVAGELGVDPMALYRHVANKEALLDGIVELLWQEVPAPDAGATDWKAAVQGLAHELRGVMVRHPNAAPLLLQRTVMPRSVLEIYRDLLAILGEVGFDERHAASIVRSVSSIALSDAALQVTYGALADPGGRPGGEPDPEAWISIAQLLPSDMPPELVRVAWAVCAPVEGADDFSFAIDLLLEGAERLRDRG